MGTVSVGPMGREAIVTKGKSAKRDTQTIKDELAQMSPVGECGKRKGIQKNSEKETGECLH